MSQPPLVQPAEAGFVVRESLRCSSCGLWFAPSDLEAGVCAGCLAATPALTKLCAICDEPVASSKHWYCPEHRRKVLDERLRRPGSRPKSEAERARLRERHRVRTVEKRAYDRLVYTAEYQAVRRSVKPQVDAGVVDCWRCGERILAGEKWHLGHVDGDPTRIAGPEHVRCNCATAKRDRRRSS